MIRSTTNLQSLLICWICILKHIKSNRYKVDVPKSFGWFGGLINNQCISLALKQRSRSIWPTLTHDTWFWKARLSGQEQTRHYFVHEISKLQLLHSDVKLGLKNKRFICPFGLKIGRVGRSIFKKKKIRTQKKCNIIHVCAFLGTQSLRIGLILVLEVVVFQYIWLKYLLGQLLYFLTFYFNIFVEIYTHTQKSTPVFFW